MNYLNRKGSRRGSRKANRFGWIDQQVVLVKPNCLGILFIYVYAISAYIPDRAGAKLLANHTHRTSE